MHTHPGRPPWVQAEAFPSSFAAPRVFPAASRREAGLKLQATLRSKLLRPLWTNKEMRDSAPSRAAVQDAPSYTGFKYGPLARKPREV